MVVENLPTSASDEILIPTNTNTKRKRRPAGTPDPEAEVVALSPKTLLESDRHVCEICNQCFQRDQNLQMHRRRHKVPWKLLKRDAPSAAPCRKRVFVCPEPSCLHHQPTHALGDLVGIKKHFRRKHSSHKQWVCGKCSKAYAVHSDFKAHLKTCGTRGHSCDCGRVFSRVESFIEHQDACHMGRARSVEVLLSVSNNNSINKAAVGSIDVQDRSTQLQLSIGSSPDLTGAHKSDGSVTAAENDTLSVSQVELVSAVEEEGGVKVKAAMAEKARAEVERRDARLQVEKAEREYANALRLRQQAQAELLRAQAFKDNAINQISAALLQITCRACLLHLNR